MVQVLKIFIYFISIQYINILPTYAIIDPFDPIVNELLAPPIVTVETLSGGNIKTTVAIAGSSPTQAVTIATSTGFVISRSVTGSPGNSNSSTDSSHNSSFIGGGSVGNTTTAGNTPNTTASTNSGPVKIFTSEMVPGANCQCVTAPLTPNDDDGNKNSDIKGDAGVACAGPVAKRKYECTVPTGLAGFQQVFAKIIRFVINIVLLLGVLAVVGLGIAWSFAGGDDIKAKSTLKTWGINIMIGLAILFFFRYILLFLAPWVYQ